MRIITLTTDLGPDSHYLAAIKATLFSGDVEFKLVDISNHIERFDINEGAFVVNLVRRDFPANTIHLIGINIENSGTQRILCVKYQEQFFFASDNGFISLLNSVTDLEIYEVAAADKSNFILRDVIVRNALALMENDYHPDKLFKKTEQYIKKIAIRPVVEKNTLFGTIVYVDSFGNAFTNITKPVFENFVGQNKFRIVLSHFEWVGEIHKYFSDVAEGQTVCIFDENDYLMIRINQGKASQLYNLKKSKPIMIELE